MNSDFKTCCFSDVINFNTNVLTLRKRKRSLTLYLELSLGTHNLSLGLTKRAEGIALFLRFWVSISDSISFGGELWVVLRLLSSQNSLRRRSRTPVSQAPGSREPVITVWLSAVVPTCSQSCVWTFLVVMTGVRERVYGIQWAGARDVTTHPTMHRTAYQEKKLFGLKCQ